MTESLQCPACGGRLNRKDGDALQCNHCNACYPVVNDIPVLICAEKSVIDTEKLIAQPQKPASKLKRILRRLLFPSLSKNWKAEKNYRRFEQEILKFAPNPQVLVVGAGEKGEGIAALLANEKIRLTETDVYFSARAKYICDAHDLPFTNESFDGVIIQAVLEHVVDPQRCAEEIRRVLKLGGIVYAETPFMQQVHEKAYDFTRFTDLGHRRLFRYFKEIDRGVCCGPAMALAWSWYYFLASLTDNRFANILLRAFASWTAFWLKYIDLFIDTRSSYQAASGFYFLGSKQAEALPDKTLITLYR